MTIRDDYKDFVLKILLPNECLEDVKEAMPKGLKDENREKLSNIMSLNQKNLNVY